MWRKSLLLVMLMGMLAFSGTAIVGCTTTGNFTHSHKDTTPKIISNEKYVDTAPGIVWDNLVAQLAKTYFVINNIDKESRIMNVSFYTDFPCNYINCGNSHVTVRRTVPRSEEGIRHYDYKSCESTTYTLQDPWNNIYGQPIFHRIGVVKRLTDLEGRMNIYVAPKGDGTLVTVNCRYIFKVNIEQFIQIYNAALTPISNEEHSKIYSCSFNTLRPGKCSRIDNILCTSTGTLEKEILDMVK